MEKYILLIAAVIGISALGWFLLRLMPGKSIAENTWPRLYGWVVVTTLLFVGLYFISPEQAQVVYYKFALVIAAAFLAYWIDRIVFPYSRPDGYLKKFWQDKPPTHEITAVQRGEVDHEVVAGYEQVFAIAMIRRAIILIAVILGATLGM